MSAAPQLASQAEEASRKRLETLRARLAMRGYELRQLDGGRFLVVRWAMSRELCTTDDVEAFACRVGA